MPASFFEDEAIRFSIGRGIEVRNSDAYVIYGVARAGNPQRYYVLDNSL